MANSFLLRFQENCRDFYSDEISAGIKKHTKTPLEQADSASTEATSKTLLAGTSTCTRIRSEQGDPDYADTARTLPIGPIMGTATKTAVKKESNDEDSRQKAMSVLPKCS
jgi:hypothetical protein